MKKGIEGPRIHQGRWSVRRRVQGVDGACQEVVEVAICVNQPEFLVTPDPNLAIRVGATIEGTEEER